MVDLPSNIKNLTNEKLQTLFNRRHSSDGCIGSKGLT